MNNNKILLLLFCKKFNYLINLSSLSNKELLWFIIQEYKIYFDQNIFYKFKNKLFLNLYYSNKIQKNNHYLNNVSFYFDNNLFLLIYCYIFGFININN